eukprot:CAMPEP_0178695534 /NCGR_PEP_ID=MMETSP0699-20121125/8914_1 /TAXON_ID=265572 /ORGANISM="Extubocellulus spinifer, Strain CCMP396" /LENGTH=510 /DNA_ID=CAMNT_0020341253 /DNA_START=1802 /DNA_END=3334 /DNA_ORIENTATION=+
MAAAAATSSSAIGTTTTMSRSRRDESLIGAACLHLKAAAAVSNDTPDANIGSGSSSSGGSGRKRRRRLAPPSSCPAAATEGSSVVGGIGMGTDQRTVPATGPLRAILTTSKALESSSSSPSKLASPSRLLSSVAMDLAHSIALSSVSIPSSPASEGMVCRCSGGCSRTAAEKHQSSSTDDGAAADDPADAEQQQQQQQCRCIDVVYIRHDSSTTCSSESSPAAVVDVDGANTNDGNTNTDTRYGELEEDEDEEDDEAELFPLRCRRVGHDMHDNEEASQVEDDNDAEGGGRGTMWNEEALSRIQIRYVRNAADLIQYLATVTMLPPHEQPLGGIVVDDVAKFVVNGNSAAASSASSLGSACFTIDSAIALTQILSLLANTADYLEQERRRVLVSSDDNCVNDDGFTLLVTIDGNSYSQLPPHARLLLQNWLPILGIVRGNDISSNGGKGDFDGNDDGWKLDLKNDEFRLADTPPFGPTERRGVAKFAIAYDEDSQDGMPEILWRNTADKK